ncbi:uncharacterized protein [Argopecten irradians]|uniref:uncharacterized protein isoform X2 n=1 Tax=Argopecten irradians TaxID=31199 RepID=UPI00371C59C9
MKKVIFVNVLMVLCGIVVRADKPDCPPDKPQVYCFVPACDESSCSVKGATCVSSSCGGCIAIWTGPEGRRLDDILCAPPPTTKPSTIKTTTTLPTTTATTTITETAAISLTTTSTQKMSTPSTNPSLPTSTADTDGLVLTAIEISSLRKRVLRNNVQVKSRDSDVEDDVTKTFWMRLKQMHKQQLMKPKK